MASVASAAATTIVDPFSVRGSLPDNSIIRYCRAEWQVVIYGAHIHGAGLPLKSLKIMRNPVSGAALVFPPLFLFLCLIDGIYAPAGVVSGATNRATTGSARRNFAGGLYAQAANRRSFRASTM